jgi:hypothetical protein
MCIYQNGRGPERDAVVLDLEQPDCFEVLLQDQKALAQALPREFVGTVAPQQCREALARVATAGLHRQIGQERAHTAGGQIDDLRWRAFEANAERPKKL